MSHAFISYWRKDSDFAEVCKAKLEAAQIETWWDRDKLGAGDEWSEIIEASIAVSFAVIVVMSPEARQSEYVTYEWSYAIGAGIPVIPILLRPTDIHPRLKRLQYLNFEDQNFRPWADLIRSLSDLQRRDTARLVIPKGTPDVLRRAITELNSPNGKDRAEAVETLSRCNDPVVEPALESVLRHPLSDIRIWAANALAVRDNKRGVETLLSIISDSKNPWADQAATYLERLPWDDDVLLHVKATLASPDPAIRARAAEMMARNQRKAAVPHLLPLLKDHTLHRGRSSDVQESVATTVEAILSRLGLLKDES